MYNLVRNSVEYKLLDNSKTIYLIGAGQLGEMTLRMWPNNKPLPIAILDTTKTGYIASIPILPLTGHKPVSNATYILSFYKASASEVTRLFYEQL